MVRTPPHSPAPTASCCWQKHHTPPLKSEAVADTAQPTAAAQFASGCNPCTVKFCCIKEQTTTPKATNKVQCAGGCEPRCRHKQQVYRPQNRSDHANQMAAYNEKKIIRQHTPLRVVHTGMRPKTNTSNTLYTTKKSSAISLQASAAQQRPLWRQPAAPAASPHPQALLVLVLPALLLLAGRHHQSLNLSAAASGCRLLAPLLLLLAPLLLLPRGHHRRLAAVACPPVQQVHHQQQQQV